MSQTTPASQSPAWTDPLLNNEQAAAYLGVTPRTLDVWRCTKRYSIPYVKVGRLVRYRKSSLDAFHQSRTIGED
ncbi:helix-turn-helix domain-containing protein [Candidatus Methylomicrobium oryzae]|uniref:helix-turn-helix domain-containing protein n=1 Tax=Candidatus Methylomicrobium oryzae TaxID=2802053 RepID=UPI001921B82E|nr:helix-turn-helix domain-containing protein [Methylomicrobium sp. RS1]MBL1264928.1 helix-turn-helix domain-containing protein [Methylomicrobium sp. RS1]